MIAMIDTTATTARIGTMSVRDTIRTTVTIATRDTDHRGDLDRRRERHARKSLGSVSVVLQCTTSTVCRDTTSLSALLARDSLLPIATRHHLSLDLPPEARSVTAAH